MATSTSARQYGRRGVTTTSNANAGNSDSGVALSPSSTGSTSTPSRRYVLDVPTGRTSRTTTNRVSDEYDESTRRSGGGVTYTNVLSSDFTNENGERLSRSGSRDYYYRDSTNYAEDDAIKKLIETSTTYTNTAQEDQEVQAITAQATPDVKNYPINVDANPELIVRPNTQRITYTQDVAVRYLKPSTPPPPGPVIIREIRAPPPPPAPPIILRQRPPPPRTPSPVIIREKPPARPKSVPTTVIKKVIPPPPPPPRKLIIERLPNLPPKPRPVIIERWLPYHKQKRQVIHEKAKPLEPVNRVRNTIIEWRPPEVEVVKQVKKLGVTPADPQRYYTQHGDKLYTTEFVQRKLTELGLQEELAIMQEQQTSASREDAAIEQADEYNVRQILNGYNQSSSSRSTYIGTSQTRSSQSGVIDEYGDQQLLYDRSPSNSGSYAYETRDGYASAGPVLTEEMLLRSHMSNDGRFPTHLLSKLGSQVYDIPADQIDLTNNSRRVTSTTTTRYYSVNQGEQGYDSAIDEATPQYGGDEKFVQLRASDLRDIMANPDAYQVSSEKVQGDDSNY